MFYSIETIAQPEWRFGFCGYCFLILWKFFHIQFPSTLFFLLVEMDFSLRSWLSWNLIIDQSDFELRSASLCLPFPSAGIKVVPITSWPVNFFWFLFLSFFKKNCLYFYCMNILPLCVPGPCGAQKRASDPRTGVTGTVGMQGIKLRASAKSQCCYSLNYLSFKVRVISESSVVAHACHSRSLRQDCYSELSESQQR